ncbi:CRISPR-associated protein Cas5 [Sphingomonas sp. MMS24-J45]|uniref:CRISPR-associated protein Cas5 n=1 Tax=Sphingomonas sp. MMS24-J45 TaxID=3238806 RepID=UPI00384D0C43
MRKVLSALVPNAAPEKHIARFILPRSRLHPFWIFQTCQNLQYVLRTYSELIENGVETLQLDVIVSGELACFRRPEFSADLVTYDVISPPVAARVLDIVFSDPQYRWDVERVIVLRPIVHRWIDLRQYGGKTHRVLALKDVSYRLSARLRHQVTGEPVANESLRSRLVSSSERQVHLGLKELAGTLRVVADEHRAAPACPGTHDLGWMLLNLRYGANLKPRYFRAIMRDGVIDLAALSSDSIAS